MRHDLCVGVGRGLLVGVGRGAKPPSGHHPGRSHVHHPSNHLATPVEQDEKDEIDEKVRSEFADHFPAQVAFARVQPCPRFAATVDSDCAASVVVPGIIFLVGSGSAGRVGRCGSCLVGCSSKKQTIHGGVVQEQSAAAVPKPVVRSIEHAETRQRATALPIVVAKPVGLERLVVVAAFVRFILGAWVRHRRLPRANIVKAIPKYRKKPKNYPKDLRGESREGHADDGLLVRLHGLGREAQVRRRKGNAVANHVSVAHHQAGQQEPEE
mmetsp:Transcript_4900/g.11532  ORF Transcript_4900/g.11532 Transcript_4900/m.11532 type:complete len:268 (-) Transcript_4900:699-1502(-)